MSGVSNPAASRMSTIFGRDDGAADDLLHGQVPLGGGLAGTGRTFGERSADGLEETHFVADVARFVAGGGECERPGERQYGVVETAVGAFLSVHGRFPGRLALLHVENPLDGSGKRCEPFLRRSGKPLAVVEAMEHGAHYLVLLQHRRDGLGLVDTCVPPIVA